MANIKLYGGRMGTSLRCHWTLHEAGVEYDPVSLNMREGENRKPEYLALNPNGQVPTLVDGDFVLFESLAINDYIAEKFKPELLGADAKEKALVMQWSIWSGVNIHRYFTQLISYRWTNTKDEKAMEDAKKGLDRFMPVLEKALEGKKFMVGDKLTLADINIVAVLTYNHGGDYDMTPYKNITMWMNSLMERPAFNAAKEEKQA